MTRGDRGYSDSLIAFGGLRQDSFRRAVEIVGQNNGDVLILPCSLED